MKNIIVVLSLVLSATFLNVTTVIAQQAAPPQENAQDAAETCDELIAYQPGGSTLVEASYSFGTELKVLLNGCDVQKILGTEPGHFYITAFDQSGGSKVLKYKKHVFDEKGVLAKDLACVLTQTEKNVPAASGASFSTVEIKNVNVCADANNPKSFVCQKGWIDCMPGAVSQKNEKYCSKDYHVWATANCGGAPQIAQ